MEKFLKPKLSDRKKVREIEIKAESCVMQHIKEFHKQALEGTVADYGNACTNCPYTKECNYDWLSIMMPLLEKSEIKISLVH